MGEKSESLRLWNMLNRQWTALAELTTDMKNHGIEVPEDAMSSLRCCKSFITHFKSHLGNPMKCNTPECQKLLSRIVTDMTNLESYLILVCVNKIGEGYAEKWSKRFMACRLGEDTS